ncbi:sulfotransferase family protein [Micromonospora sp. RP3T]|uniref:sulfotransferase-like domain-containing protein n=1 Tax=Micromonospora sp. RP3T TaxID=2135446 RepID=UPI000D1637D8|nr:sulfotransferase family protein [Micromonospora sp. RP3T]PTA46522.1 sulfotransferase family protein [Micromonospora sp. RP3T]
MGAEPDQRLIALWSAPRCRSTAFYRMVAERGDLRVVHEPFSYRAEFGTVEVGGRSARTEPEVLAALRALATGGRVFFKDTTDERYPAVLADRAFLATATHVFLIRHPARTIASYHAVNPEVTLDQIGFGHLRELHDAVAAAGDRPPLVIDADEMVADPAAASELFCARAGLPSRPDALSWSAGHRADWAPTERWHAGVASSTGFHRRDGDYGDVVRTDARLRAYLDHHEPHYRALYERRARLVRRR